MKKSSKIFLIAFLTVAIVLSFMGKSAFAANNYASGDSIILPKEEVVDTDYFAAGKTVLVSGTVNGDAYVAGGSVIIDGIINGDLLAAGGTINITGQVNGDIRAAGGQISISGPVERNITATGGSITIQPAAQVGGSVTAAGGTLNLLAPIGRGVTIAGGQASLHNSIGGDVTAAIEELSLSPQTVITGRLTYWSNNKASIAPGATINNEVVFNKTDRDTQKARQDKSTVGFSVAWTLANILISFVLGYLLLRFMPAFSQDVVTTITSRPWVSLGIGFLATLLFPFAFILLLLTIIGIPFALILLFGLFLIMIFNNVFIALAIGQKIVPNRRAWALLAGLGIYGVVLLIPVVNWIAGMIAFFIGFGAIIITKKNLYYRLRTQKLI